MAEALADDLAMVAGLEVECRSAGTLDLDGRPAEPRVVAVCREVGLDLSRHRSQPLTPELLQWADHVLVMEEDHAVEARERWDGLAEDRVVALGPLAGRAEISDPIGSWFKGPYRTARDDIRTALERFLRGLARP
jgi:protein-tyrosine-phosphatase